MKNSFRNTIRVSNSLDTDQVLHFVGPDLGSYQQTTLLGGAKSFFVKCLHIQSKDESKNSDVFSYVKGLHIVCVSFN